MKKIFCSVCGEKTKKKDFFKKFNKKTGKRILQSIMYCPNESKEPLKHDIKFLNVEYPSLLDKPLENFLEELRGGKWKIHGLTKKPYKVSGTVLGRIFQILGGARYTGF